MPRLDRKVAVITGSTRGFGFAIARELLEAGSRVVISGRMQSDVDKAVEELKPFGEVIGSACDVSLPEQVYALAKFALERYGQIDIWINNAGYSLPPGRIIDFSPEEARSVFQTNSMGSHYGTQAAFHAMQTHGRGQIVLIYGRGSDLKSASPTGLYGATKAWITSFTRTLAAELKDSGIQVIGFSPGMMMTDMLAIDEVVGESIRERMQFYPLVLRALAHPPEFSARLLVRILANSRKPFVEHRVLNPLRLLIRSLKLAWMIFTHKEQSSETRYLHRDPFIPPIE